MNNPASKQPANHPSVLPGAPAPLAISPVDNPYIGPRPFKISERDRFFGRENEANSLIPMVVTERLVLLYAESGAGKSSLINARLSPGLLERNFKVLNGRVGGQIVDDASVDNIYIHNLLLSLEHDEHEDAGSPAGSPAESPTVKPPADEPPGESGSPDLGHMTLAEYLAELDLEPTPPQTLVPAARPTPSRPYRMLVDAPQIIEGLQPLALIIDQFEEIFTTHPEEWEKRAEFFEQLREAQEKDPYLWVVLAIREDYIARLDPYTHLLYGGDCVRFHLQRMEQKAALEAVRNPVRMTHPFARGVAEELVDNLRRLPPGECPENVSGNLMGQYVEPVQLQVVCYQLWEQLKDKPEGSFITEEDLNRLARGGDLAQFISGALADFYEQAITNVVQAIQDGPDRERVTERKLRDWFSHKLITERETADLVFRGDESTEGMPNRAVELLEQQFIIRTENRGSGVWYELSHDRFIAPILQSNRAWLINNPRPIQAAAEAWELSGRSPEKLYEGHQLKDAQALLKTPTADLSDLEREFIRASQSAHEHNQTRRTRALTMIFATLLVILTVLTVTSLNNARAASASAQEAFIQRGTAVVAMNQANVQRMTAVVAGQEEARQRQTAEVAKMAAETASAKEAMQRQTAEAAKAAAENARAQEEMQRQTAVAAAAIADAANAQAQASRLSSLSDYFRDTKLDLSLLLSIEAARMSNNNLEARRALLNSIQSGLKDRISRAGYPWYTATVPYSIAFSPDGTQVVVGAQDHIYLRTTANGEFFTGMPADFEARYQMFSVAFDGTGNLLARGGGDGKIIIWDRKANTTRTFSPFPLPFRAKFSSILSIAFQPGGDLLAASTDVPPDSDRGQVYLYNYKEPGSSAKASFECERSACGEIAWSPDGKRLAFTSQNGALRVIDVNTNTTVWNNSRAHNGKISGLAWYPDGYRLVTGGYDGRLVQWDIVAQKILRQTIMPNQTLPMSLAISPDGRFVLAGTNDAGSWFGLWDGATLQKLDFKVSGHSRYVTAVAFAPQSNQFATTGLDNTVVLWNIEQVDSLGTLLVNLASPHIETVSQDGIGRLIYARNTGDGKVEIIKQDDKVTTKFQAPHTALTFAQVDGRQALVLGGADGQISFVDPSSGSKLREPVSTAGGQVRSVAVSPDGRLLATASCESSSSCKRLTLRDLSSGELLPLQGELSKQQINNLTSLAFSPDGQTLAIGAATGTITLYDLSSGEIRQAVTEGLSLQTKNVAVSSLVYSPADLGLLIAGFKDGRIALWDAASVEPVGEFSERLNGEVTGLMVRKSAESGLWKLVSVSNQGEAREWAIDPNDWQARACQMAARNLTDGEKDKFLLPGTSRADVCPAVKK